MTAVKIRIPTPLRGFTGGASEVSVQGATVRDALSQLERTHHGTTERILDERGELRSFVNVYLGEKNVSVLDGLDTALPSDAVLSILPAVAGGLGRTSAWCADERGFPGYVDYEQFCAGAAR